MKNKHTTLLLITILAITLFFRTFNFTTLQQWNGDDEILTATIRHIVWDASPTLLIPNSFLEFGLGPFYYYLLTPFYFITNFDLVFVQAIGTLLGLATTYFIYLCGKILLNQKTGFIAASLYASSFLISLFDRRVWPLSLGPLMSAITIFALAKVLQKDFRFIPLLALPIGFSFHSDLSLVILVISIVITWITFKFLVPKKHLIIFLAIIAIFASPFILAEIRYKGAVSGPVIKSISRPLRDEGIAPESLYNQFTPRDFIDSLARTLFVPPSQSIEQHWCHSNCNYPTPLFTPITQIAVIGVMLLSFLTLFKRSSVNKQVLIVLWITLASFIFGLFIFNRIFKANFNQLYFLVVYPAFILLVANTITQISRKSFLALLMILFFFSVNFYTLVNSSVRYSLEEKRLLVRKSIEAIGKDKFALYASSSPEIQGGGWTELYNLEKHPPVKSYWYDFSEWLYAAYSLFPGPLQKEDPEKIVIIQKTQEGLELNQKIISRYTYKDIELYVIDNSQRKKF